LGFGISAQVRVSRKISKESQAKSLGIQPAKKRKSAPKWGALTYLSNGIS
jgi:hypothetical protein